jgi:hypothetical protein
MRFDTDCMGATGVSGWCCTATATHADSYDHEWLLSGASGTLALCRVLTTNYPALTPLCEFRASHARVVRYRHIPGATLNMGFRPMLHHVVPA